MKLQEWQKGYDSQLSSMERAILHDIWLKDIHEQLKKEITSTKNTGSTESEIVGFIEIN